MTEADRTGPDGKAPRQNQQEIPVARDYLEFLVKNYVRLQRQSSVLAELFKDGLPSDKRTKPAPEEQNPKQDLRDVLFSLLEIYDFWGEIPTKKPTSDRSYTYQPFYQHQGLPRLGLIILKHSLPGVENPTIRFRKNGNGNIVVKGVDYRDFGERGFPPGFFMASEQLVVNFDGGVTVTAEYYPGKDQNGIERQYFRDHPLPLNSLPILKSLVTIALNGARLREEGQIYQSRESVDSRGISQRKVGTRPRIFT